MRRSVRTVLKDALKLFWKDVKDMRLAVAAIAGYLWVSRTFFRSSCIGVTITGFPCPGCGLTRAASALLRGEFRKAFWIHPFIYGIAVLFFVFCMYRYLLRRSQKVLVKWTAVLLAGMIVFYVFRMIFVFPGEPPMSYYRHNLIQLILHSR